MRAEKLYVFSVFLPGKDKKKTPHNRLEWSGGENKDVSWEKLMNLLLLYKLPRIHTRITSSWKDRSSWGEHGARRIWVQWLKMSLCRKREEKWGRDNHEREINAFGCTSGGFSTQVKVLTWLWGCHLFHFNTEEEERMNVLVEIWWISDLMTSFLFEVGVGSRFENEGQCDGVTRFR